LIDQGHQNATPAATEAALAAPADSAEGTSNKNPATNPATVWQELPTPAQKRDSNKTWAHIQNSLDRLIPRREIERLLPVDVLTRAAKRPAVTPYLKLGFVLAGFTDCCEPDSDPAINAAPIQRRS
jgi:hypothetical protein